MVIDDLNVVSIAVFKTKAHAPLFIDAYAPLSGAVMGLTGTEMKPAMPVSLSPTLSRKRARGQAKRYASFTIQLPTCWMAAIASVNACGSIQLR
jgi:hypothetical protein